MKPSDVKTVTVIGAGTMGRGIAQIAATCGKKVNLVDSNSAALDSALSDYKRIFARLIEKGRMTSDEMTQALSNISFHPNLTEVANADFFIEAVVENLNVKQTIFKTIESFAAPTAVLATNTSSLAVTAIAGACEHSERVIGVHFFNPAPLMPLVEIVPGIATDSQLTKNTRALIDDWGKTTVIAKDTPGFIVNRVARPFYGESIRIFEEGIADAATIDWALREIGGFRMGPFQLMDLIGIDINFTVTETVFEAFFYDPRFKPSFTQKRMVEAGYLGKKSGRGFYDYADGAAPAIPDTNNKLGQQIVDRVVAMLINEAADAVFMQIAAREDVDLAMTKGVNYPKGLLAWADEIGLDAVLARLNALQDEYGEDRYRANPLLKRLVREGHTFYS
ncbi:MAG: 3-hydroxyacyl-CoA dehydrogenase NAD-binding domain-containing protein [Calditrichia bacterium]